MATSTMHDVRSTPMAESAATAGATALAVPIARAFLAAIFLSSGPAHFTPGVIGYAASQGVPFASLLVPASGALAILGGLSVLLGFRARIGAAFLVAFLVPVTLTMHAFWKVADPQMQQMQYLNFMKNLGLLGGALLVLHHGAGPFSFDARRANARRNS